MSQKDDVHSEIHEFERQRQRALIDVDTDALQRLLADDLIHIHSTGMVHDKPGFMEHIKRMGGFVAVERRETNIQIDGNLAIVTGNTMNTVRSRKTGEQVSLDGFSTLLLRRVNGHWQIVLSQLTPNRSKH